MPFSATENFEGASSTRKICTQIIIPASLHAMQTSLVKLFPLAPKLFTIIR